MHTEGRECQTLEAQPLQVHPMLRQGAAATSAPDATMQLHMNIPKGNGIHTREGHAGFAVPFVLGLSYWQVAGKTGTLARM